MSRLTASPPNRASSGYRSLGRPPIVFCCPSLNHCSAAVVKYDCFNSACVHFYCYYIWLTFSTRNNVRTAKSKYSDVVKVCMRGFSNNISAYNHCESVTTIFFPCKCVFPLAHALCFLWPVEPTSSSAACSLHFWTHPFILVCHKLYLSFFPPWQIGFEREHSVKKKKKKRMKRKAQPLFISGSFSGIHLYIFDRYTALPIRALEYCNVWTVTYFL